MRDIGAPLNGAILLTPLCCFTYFRRAVSNPDRPSIQWIVSNPFSLSANRTPVYFETGWAYKVLTKTNFMCLGLVYAHKKENLPKVTLKARKGHISIFEPKESTLDPYL